MRRSRKKMRLFGLLIVVMLPFVYWWQSLLPQQDELVILRQRVEKMRTQLQSSSVVPVPEVQLAEVMQHVGTAAQLPERVENLHGLLHDYGITLSKAVYKLVSGVQGGIDRYEIQLEVNGPYYGIRLFSRALLVQDESVALESINFSRQPGDGGRIRASMRWVMFVKGNSQ